MSHKILIVDDNDILRRQMVQLVSTELPGCDCREAYNEHVALELIEQSLFSVVLTDVNLSDAGGAENGGLAVLEAAKNRDPDTQVVVVTAFMSAVLPGQVRRRHGFSCVDRTSDYYPKQLPYEVRDAIQRFEQARAAGARLAFKIFLPPRSDEAIQFQLMTQDEHPHTTRRHLVLEFGAMKEATAGIGSLIYLNEPDQCAALSQFVGRHLWDRLFGDHDDLLLGLGEARGITRSPSHLPIRIISERDALEVPFELLHDGIEYLALQHPLVREVRGARAAQLMFPVLLEKLRESRQPLRVLLIAADSCSKDLGLSPIPMVDEEVLKVRDLFRNYELPVSPHVEALMSWQTSFDLMERKFKERWHVIHYAGHGTHEGHRNNIHLWEHPCAETDWLKWRAAGEDPVKAHNIRGRLLPLASTQVAHRLEELPPSLIYLNCCHSARTADAHFLLFGKSLGLVDALARVGVPTVVGHRWPLVDTEISLKFVKTFYENLLSDYMPEQAILRARRELQDHDYIWASSVMFVQYPGS